MAQQCVAAVWRGCRHDVWTGFISVLKVGSIWFVHTFCVHFVRKRQPQMGASTLVASWCVACMVCVVCAACMVCVVCVLCVLCVLYVLCVGGGGEPVIRTWEHSLCLCLCSHVVRGVG